MEARGSSMKRDDEWGRLIVVEDESSFLMGGGGGGCGDWLVIRKCNSLSR